MMKLCIYSSSIVAALMAASSSVGLAVGGLYRDNELVAAGWRGNDVVTLALAVPLLIGAIVLARRGSKRGLLIGLGLLAYAAYNYAFYLFGAAFNSLFLPYAGVLAFSTLGLIGGLASTEIRALAAGIRVNPRDRSIGWLVIAIALVLGIFWTVTSAAFVFTGAEPAMVEATGHPTNVTAALDLWLVVTFGVLGGAWLVRGKAWGFVVSAVWTVKGAVYMTALSAASVSAFLSGAADSLAQLGLWIPIGTACVLGAAVLLRPSGPAESIG